MLIKIIENRADVPTSCQRVVPWTPDQGWAAPEGTMVLGWSAPAGASVEEAISSFHENIRRLGIGVYEKEVHPGSPHGKIVGHQNMPGVHLRGGTVNWYHDAKIKELPAELQQLKLVELDASGNKLTELPSALCKV